MLLIGFVHALEIQAAEITQNRVITIDEVRLKNEGGEWVAIIKPDKKVDTMDEEPNLSFFNQGLVPPAEYINFEILIRDTAKPEGLIHITGKRDFNPLPLKKASFVNVYFTLDFENEWHIHRVELTVDQTTRVILEDQIAIQR